MENDQEINETANKIFTLNVNAVEFVPSFAKTIEDPPPVAAPKAPAETPENNGNGKMRI